VRLVYGIDNAGSGRLSHPVRPNVASRCAVDSPSDPLKFPRPFLIKNTHRSYPFIAPFCLPAVSEEQRSPSNCRPCLPGVAPGRLQAAALGYRPCLLGVTLATRLLALPARCGARPPLSLGCPLPPYRIAWLVPPYHLAQPLLAGPLPPADSIR
jgi:hypothetical protein